MFARKVLLAGIANICLICLVGLLYLCTIPAPLRVQLLKTTRGSDARAWFQFENRRDQSVEVRVQCLEEEHGREWRWSREAPATEVLGTQGTRLTWTVPAHATNVFFCQVPTTESGYRLNLECRLGGTNPSNFGDHLRNYLANLVYLSCPPVGPGARVMSLGKSKLMSRIRGGTWLVTETFCARSSQQAAKGPGVFTTGVNIPDERNAPFKRNSLVITSRGTE